MPMPSRCYKRSLAIGKKHLVPIIPMSRLALNNLAVLYQDQGRYADAEPLYKRSLAIYEKALRSRSSRCCDCAEQSGCPLQRSRSLCRCRAAVQARRWRYTKKRLVPIIPMLRRSLNNLAGSIRNQGRYADAEPLYKRSLAIREKALGPDHPDVARFAEQSG